MSEKHIFICKRMKLLYYLKTKGFYPIKQRPDNNNPNYTVWLFIYSDELQKTVDEYYLMKPIK